METSTAVPRPTLRRWLQLNPWWVLYHLTLAALLGLYAWFNRLLFESAETTVLCAVGAMLFTCINVVVGAVLTYDGVEFLRRKAQGGPWSPP